MSKNRDSNSQAPEHEHERVRTLIEESQNLPNSLRYALLKRLDEEKSSSRSQNKSTLESSAAVGRMLESLKKAPSEVIGRVSQKVEEIRIERVEQVKSEVRKFVENIDLQKELIKLLSQISIDLNTTIRLVPDDDTTMGIKPKVTTKAKINWGEEAKEHEHSDEAHQQDDTQP